MTTKFQVPAKTKILIAMFILVVLFLLGLVALSKVNNQNNNTSWWQNLKIWQLSSHFNISSQANKIKDFRIDTEVFSNPKYSNLENEYEPPTDLPLAGNPNPFLGSSKQ